MRLPPPGSASMVQVPWARRRPAAQHAGTEILYMLEGVMVYGHGKSSYTLHPGDALQFDGEAPHGPERLVELPIRFLTVTAFGDSPHH
ncbi:cupin domain-containing protein [Streptomyces sp. T028]|uniref:cupin domain-containing protein n=1 Tax=Streptomyces sp. T028 TaxID=3394379 RepID=UPI003A853E68